MEDKEKKLNEALEKSRESYKKVKEHERRGEELRLEKEKQSREKKTQDRLTKASEFEYKEPFDHLRNVKFISREKLEILDYILSYILIITVLFYNFSISSGILERYTGFGYMTSTIISFFGSCVIIYYIVIFSNTYINNLTLVYFIYWLFGVGFWNLIFLILYKKTLFLQTELVLFYGVWTILLISKRYIVYLLYDE